jgi:predicted ATPase
MRDGRARHDRSMDLLERDTALAVLAEYAEARTGDGRFILVAGEAGAGKTALIEAFRAQVADARWLEGVCDGAFTPEPLQPFFDVDPLGR